MSGKVQCRTAVLFGLIVAVGGTLARAETALPAAAITSEQATALAVNRLEAIPAGYRLAHPRRQVDFTPDGVRIVGRRGAPAWSWSLRSIASASGRSLVEVGPVAPVEVESGLIRYDRCSILEDYRLKVDSVEQLFTIPDPLPLDGEDLVLVGAVDCGGDLMESGRGWEWRAGHGRVTLGRATVLDAAGERIPARLTVCDGATRLEVDGSALLTAAYPVVVDPEIGSNDVRISDMGPDGDPSYDGYMPAVAYNSVNNTYLVVWQGNDNTGGLVEGENEIFGQVLSATGDQICDNDVRISYAGGTGNPDYDAGLHAVAFNSVDNEYLVVWTQDTNEGGLADDELEIWGQVVDPCLSPLYGGNFRISTMGPDGDPAFDATRPAVAYNPNADEYLVVWEGDTNTGGLVDGESEIWAQRVTSIGILVGSNLRMSDMGGTGDPTFGAYAPAVAFNSRDNEYLIVWYGDDNTPPLVDEEFEIYGQLITWEGVGTGPNDYRLSDMGGLGDPAYDGYAPAVAYNPLANEYLVVWLGADNVGGLVEHEIEVFSQRLDADLNGLGGNDFRLSDAGGIGDPNYDVWWGPGVAFSPILNQYMVVWAGEDTVDGMVDDETEVFAQLLTWNIQGIGPNDERISDAGGLGNTLYITRLPVVAANSWNGQFLVAWEADDDQDGMVQGEREIFIQRMDGMAVFVDAFESGDTGAWSSVTP